VTQPENQDREDASEMLRRNLQQKHQLPQEQTQQQSSDNIKFCML